MCTFRAPLRRCPRLRLAVALASFSMLCLPGAAQGFEALVFSKTAGFRHDSIPDGITMIQQLAAQNSFTANFTEDANAFTTGNLAQYEVVIFLNTTGDVLNSAQEAAFMGFIQSGKGYVGIHSASDTEYGWAWYGGLVGAYFASHPPGTTNATIEVADRDHPSSSVLPKIWARHDEWYDFQTNPRGNVHVLATLDEGTYSGGTMGFDHPIAWCQEYDGGRAWYTAGGHTSASYSETLFRNHVLNGIKWAAGVIGGDGEASIPANYQKVALDTSISEPMSLAVAPDGRVFFIERGGALKIYRPAFGNTVQAGTLGVTTANEDGLLGIALDPSFATNQWIYLFYSPVSPSQQRLSRFTMSGDVLNLSSEIIMLTVPTQRAQCCHSSGALAFGNNGQLFISTGDNTNPFESSGYTPIDERAGRSDWDAQKSSSNRNDLRGKILRIVPQPSGSYTIPAGNLFPSDGSNGRAEVYVMGCRNPFRISVDTETGWLYWGDVGPDANTDSSSRGPMGYDEINQARNAGNFGWPYCIANNLAYRDYNFATGASGSFFNCAAPINNSPNNTGSQSLPASQGAFIWYPYSNSSLFPEMNGGSINRTIMAGPVYHYDPAAPSSTKLPAYYDDTLFIYEWSRNYIKEVKLDDNGNVLKINPFMQTTTFNQPIEMEFGADGNMYMLEWNPPQLSRIEYVRGDLSPVAIASGSPDSGTSPLTVQFSSAGSFDPDGTIIAYEWDFQSNGSVDSMLPNPSFIYTNNGSFTARLTVRDNDQNIAIANVPIVVGNSRPVVSLYAPVDGGFFDWNTTVPFQATVVDAQDGSTTGGNIPCSSVIIQPYIGHDSHTHALSQLTGCSGLFTILSDGGHPPEDNLYYVLEARYTDNGAPGSIPLTGNKFNTLQPKRKQAEHFTTSSGIQLENTGDVLGGGQNVGHTTHGDYISFKPMNLLNISQVTYRAASAGWGGTIEICVDSPTGTLISTATIPVTGDWQTYTNVTTNITNPGGTHELFFVFKRNPGDDGLFNLNWIDFVGGGVSSGSMVTVDMGAPDLENGIQHSICCDGNTIPWLIGNRTARVNDAPSDFYMYFNVNDTYTLNGDKPNQIITVDYFDTGTGSLTLQYDALSAAYKVGPSVALTNSNTWKMVTWQLSDAYFGNRQNGGADFRVAYFGGDFFLDLVTASTSTSAQTPFGGVVRTIPGTIQAEDFDNGGEGVAYHDLSGGNFGGAYRSTDVDIENTADTGGGYNVGFIDTGEWIEYTVNVTSAGTYELGMRVASCCSGGSFHVEMNGVNVSGAQSFPSTGDWQAWTTKVVPNVNLSAGQQIMRVVIDSGGWNFNHIQWALPTTTISNSAFNSNADGWNIVVWRSGPYADGTMGWQSSSGNPGGNMLSNGSGASNNTDSCTREGGEINKAISTAGYNTLIQVQYDLRFETNQTGSSPCIGSCTGGVLQGDCADKLAVYYSTSGTGGPWTLLEQVYANTVTQNTWLTRTINLPSAANNKPNFALRFRSQFNQSTDGARLDNIKVIGTP